MQYSLVMIKISDSCTYFKAHNGKRFRTAGVEMDGHEPERNMEG